MCKHFKLKLECAILLSLPGKRGNDTSVHDARCTAGWP